jgi:UDP-N-acetylglucosamine:LPS N-acetylglucosamine transferase
VSSQQKVLLVCSPGGHLLQMHSLEPAWTDLDRTWVTLESTDVEYLLANEKVVIAHGPAYRSIKALLLNLRLAWKVVREQQPDAILSTGAALAVPFFLVGKVLRKRLIYVESISFIDRPSLTGRLVYPLADSFFVQWQKAARRKRSTYAGGLI